MLAIGWDGSVAGEDADDEAMLHEFADDIVQPGLPHEELVGSGADRVVDGDAAPVFSEHSDEDLEELYYGVPKEHIGMVVAAGYFEGDDNDLLDQIGDADRDDEGGLDDDGLEDIPGAHAAHRTLGSRVSFQRRPFQCVRGTGRSPFGKTSDSRIRFRFTTCAKECVVIVFVKRSNVSRIAS